MSTRPAAFVDKSWTRAALLSVIIAVLVLAAPAQAVTLVNPAETPIGGIWQRWADEMRVLTVRGRLTPDNPADAEAMCGTAAGCSQGWDGMTPEVWIDGPHDNRQTLYYELGHEFDWLELNAGDRRFLAREWGAPHARWWDSEASLERGSEDGLEGVFPQIYADCASGINDQGTDLSVGFYGANALVPPGVTPEINTCEYLTRLALRLHASVPRWVTGGTRSRKTYQRP